MFYSSNKEVHGLPKLSSSASYPNWSFQLRLYFQSKGLWNIVKGTEPKPVVSPSGVSTDTTPPALAVTEDDLEAWRQKDSAAQLAISLAVSPSQNVHIVSKTSSKDAWKALENVHEKQGQSALYSLLTRLVSAKFKDGDDLEEHISLMVNTHLDLASINEPLPDKHLVVFLLHSLPQSWDTVVMMIESLPSSSSSSSGPTSETVIAKLLAEAERRKVGSSSSNRRLNAAALSSNPPTSSSSEPKKDLSKVECFKCHRFGHYADKCTVRKKTNAKKSVEFSLVVRTVDPDTAVAFRTHQSEERPEHWLVDSGAGENFTGDRQSLSSFVDSPLLVEVANGARIVSPGYGKRTLSFKNGSKLQLSKVFYLPGATTGLLSVSYLSDKGGTVSFNKDRIAQIFVGSTLVTKTIPGTRYQLPLLRARIPSTITSSSPPPSIPPSSKSLSSNPFFSLSTTSFSSRDTGAGTLLEWHRRLGHISFDAILELDRSNSVNGMILTDKKKVDCEACNLSKSKRSPFRTVSTNAPHVLYRVFINLGFVDHADRDGNKVYLAIVDQFTCAKWTFTLPSKSSSGVVEIWSSWKEMVERLTGQKVGQVRSDNGGEFISQEFEAALERDGIFHERTAPYTPEQNGQVERLNGSLLTLVKTMLKDSNVDKSFWSFALSVATFISNRSPHPRFRDKTPFELVTGKKASIKHLHPFGSPSFVHIDKSLRKKLDDSAVKGFLVGYDGEYNYKVFVPELDRVVVSRHVHFSKLESPDPSFLPLDDVPDITPSDDQPPRPEQVPEPAPSPPSPPSSPSSPLPSSDKYEYVTVRTGPNPGRFEEIDTSNIIEGGRRSRIPVAYGKLSQEDVVFVKLSKTLDADVQEVDGTWEEESVLVGVAMVDTPRNFHEAMALDERERWRDAIETEWNAFDTHGVLKISKLPPGARALGTTWVFVKKTDADRKVLRYKARLVARGFAQRPGIDVNETFAPVARLSTIRFLTAYAASQGLCIESFDWETAFLNGGMTEDVFIKVPPGYPHPHSPGDVLKLEKSMYGTKQAPREWNKAVNSLMEGRGFKKSSTDSFIPASIRLVPPFLSA
ncbi:uncharacterized protein JCM6883_001929 [Sporobolomyces salmoneus]|uniref:uncharacterized protein n=1 Tax=Sporobolomyces salmoneus TaxID=183962 RepID=UPI00317FE7EC